MIGRTGRRARLRLWAVLALIAAVIAGAAFAIGNRRGPDRLAERAEAEKPALLLLTSLPIVFPEQFALEGGSPALTALERRYRVEPIAVADGATLSDKTLLLMAHPLAQPAEALVELDQWVRGGGRLVLLADPKLDWPSNRPLGDKFRPSPAFADTGLLKHWGLTLYAPEQPGPVGRRIDGLTVLLSSPGILSGTCKTLFEGLIARCSIGRGQVTVIADADFLRSDGADADGLQWLLRELDRVERD